MRTLGVDLSANPAKTGACLIDWEAVTVDLLPRPTEDDAILAAAREADMVALDVPLGWPDGFVQAVVAHHAGTGWPPVAYPPPGDRLPLRYRATDLAVRARGGAPLSVSSDLIGVAAMRGARLQQLLEDDGIPVDRSGMSGRVIETYPAMALRQWGLRSTGYKGRTNADTCRTLVAELLVMCGPIGVVASATLEGCDDDALDAFVCALVARARLLGRTDPPPPHLGSTAHREGWIHLPSAGLADALEIKPAPGRSSSSRS